MKKEILEQRGKPGEPVPGRPGFVFFANGQIPEEKYKEWKEGQDEELKEIKKTHQKLETKIKRKTGQIGERGKEGVRGLKEGLELQQAEMLEIALGGTEERELRKKLKEKIKKVKKEDIEEIGNITGKIRDLIIQGYSKPKICDAMNHTENWLDKYLKRWTGKTLDGYIKSVKSREQEVLGEKRPTRDWILVPKPQFRERERAGACLIVSDEKKSYKNRRYPKAEPGRKFSKEMNIFPDKTIQPIKRMRKIAHAFLTAGEWSNGRKLYSAVGQIARRLEDKFITHEGGIIISKRFAEKENISLGDKI